MTLDLGGQRQGAGCPVVLMEPVDEVFFGPEGEGLGDGMHGERHAVAGEEGLQVLRWKLTADPAEITALNQVADGCGYAAVAYEPAL
ncbi:hypothetical protein ABII15_00270 [Streptomyces sp. HUAS MG91]|uniref:Glyoxalase-like domain-containing protein n=1 Tax=Streptomyces tabacisoli TaxID=3156398 RepID=A0AAU8IK54_9ACTN